MPNGALDPNCYRYENKMCVQCSQMYDKDPVTGRCLQVDANCADWNYVNHTCTVCYIGYYVYNQIQCKLIRPEVASPQLKSDLNTDINCRKSDSTGRCSQCIWRYVINRNSMTCIKVDDLCRTWNQ